MITHENIFVKFDDLELNETQELKIIAAINEHTRISLSCIVAVEGNEKLLDRTDADSNIEVGVVTESVSVPQIIFRGIVTVFKLKMVCDVYHIEVEGVSFTYLMDIKQRERSFQNPNMRYRELFTKVTAAYPGADFIMDTAMEKLPLEPFILEYRETDWDFLKRVASYSNAGLMPESAAAAPKFWVGDPERGDKGEIQLTHYTVRKRVGSFRSAVANYIEVLHLEDSIEYEVESDQLLCLGDVVAFRGRRLFVRHSVVCLKQGVLKSTYFLTPDGGIKQNKMYNQDIRGLSLEGSVIDVNQDQIRVHLEIDKEQKQEEAIWFPYCTPFSNEGSTGWHCMPEVGDSIKLYFPSVKEEEAFVTTSIRRGEKAGERLQKPETKYFRTVDEKEMMFSDKDLTVSGRDALLLIRLNIEQGVEISSELDIDLTARENLIIDVGKRLTVTAGEEIHFQCRESELLMNEEIMLNAKRIKQL